MAPPLAATLYHPFTDRLRLLPEASLEPLVDILAKFTPPFPTPSGVLVEDPTTRHSLIAADVDLLNDVSSILESLALDSEDIQVLLAQTAAYHPSLEGTPLIKYILDFVEFGDYPPSWSREILSEQGKRKKTFDMCKAALIKTVVEVTGALRCIDILWDLNQPNGWFVSRLIRWVQANVTSNRDDLVVCATLCLGNLARRGA
jgi:Rap1 GTPase-GDP dissociation stimulator 1